MQYCHILSCFCRFRWLHHSTTASRKRQILQKCDSITDRWGLVGVAYGAILADLLLHVLRGAGVIDQDGASGPPLHCPVIPFHACFLPPFCSYLGYKANSHSIYTRALQKKTKSEYFDNLHFHMCVSENMRSGFISEIASSKRWNMLWQCFNGKCNRKTRSLKERRGQVPKSSG